MSNTTWQDETVQALKQGYQSTIDEQAATIARLTAAHEMQGESLVVLPRWMVSNMEDKMKAQAEDIRKLKQALNKYSQMIECLPKDDIGGGIAALVKYCKNLAGDQ